MAANSLLLLGLMLPAAFAQTSVDYCQALVDAISICSVETPGFTALPTESQQACLCASTIAATISWGPDVFDDAASLCASQYATKNPKVASDAIELEDFCSGYGAAVTATSAPAAATTPIAATTPVATPGFSTSAPAPTSSTNYANPEPGITVGSSEPMTTPTSSSVVTFASPTNPSTSASSTPNAAANFAGVDFGMMVGLAVAALA